MPLDKEGREILDSRPLEVPLGFEKPETLQETMRRLIRDEHIRAELMANGIETFDEAEDFDCDEDDDGMPDTPWETEFDPVLGKEIYRKEKEELDKVRKEFDDNVKEEKKKRWFNWNRKGVDKDERGRDSKGSDRDGYRRSREDYERDHDRNDASHSRRASEEV